jgi:hypothetical protein
VGQDLSRPDALMQLPFRLPFFGSELNCCRFDDGFIVQTSWLHQPWA